MVGMGKMDNHKVGLTLQPQVLQENHLRMVLRKMDVQNQMGDQIRMDDQMDVCKFFDP